MPARMWKQVVDYDWASDVRALWPDLTPEEREHVRDFIRKETAANVAYNRVGRFVDKRNRKAAAVALKRRAEMIPSSVPRALQGLDAAAKRAAGGWP
jgi:hypothetical protein